MPKILGKSIVPCYKKEEKSLEKEGKSSSQYVRKNSGYYKKGV